MNCKTCDQTMRHLDSEAFWCPRCGTVEVRGAASHHVPKLVERCREFEADHYMHPTTLLGEKWQRLGISESIHKPEERPTPSRPFPEVVDWVKEGTPGGKP